MKVLDIPEQEVQASSMEPVADIDARGCDRRVVSLAVEQVIEYSSKPAVFTLRYGTEVSPDGANWIAVISKMVRARGMFATCVNEGGIVTCRVMTE